MGVIRSIIAAIKAMFGCKHLYPEARVELVPDLEYVRYFWECPCGVTWDD